MRITIKEEGKQLLGSLINSKSIAQVMENAMTNYVYTLDSNIRSVILQEIRSVKPDFKDEDLSKVSSDMQEGWIDIKEETKEESKIVGLDGKPLPPAIIPDKPKENK